MKSSYPEVFIIILIVGGPVALAFLGLYYLFCYVQDNILLKSGDLLLIRFDYLEVCFIFLGIAVFSLIIIRIDKYSYIGKLASFCNKVKPVYLITATTLIIIFILSILMMDYTKVSTTGIHRNIIYLKKSVFYTWDDVKDVKIFYTIDFKGKGTGNKYKFHYVLYMKDDSEIDLRNSYDFWNKVEMVDNVIKNNKIKIDRGSINKYEADKILHDDYKDSNLNGGLDVLSRITILSDNDISP